MRVCFTSDLHGDPLLYEQLTDLLRRETPGLLILGGDLLPDIRPDGAVLPQVTSIVEELVRRIEAWRRAQPDLTVACILGNHDLAPCGALFAQHAAAGAFVFLEPSRVLRFGGWAWLGYSCAPPSPHWAKDYERLDLATDPTPSFEGVAWDEVTQKLRPVDLEAHFHGRAAIADDLHSAAYLEEPWILVAHAPPSHTNLDRLPQVPHPIGSRAVRVFIEARQPALSLHGHVHESPRLMGGYTDRIGPTLCVNPGQGVKQLHAVLFELERPAETLRHTVLP